MAALQAQHAHWMEQQKGLEARLRLQEEKYLQGTAPTRVEIIREQVMGPATHVHPNTAQPDASAQMAQVGQLIGDMHRTLSEHAARQAGDMRESMRSWLNEALSIRNRPPPAPAMAAPPPSFVPGQSASGLDRSTQNSAQRAARSAEVHTTHEPARRRERSRSPQRASESADATAAVATQRTAPARVQKPRAIAAPKPKKYGPTVGIETTPAPPPDDPPPSRRKKIPVGKSKFAQSVKPRAPAPAPAPSPEPIQERKHIVKTAATFIKKKKSTKPATVKPAPADTWVPAAAKVPKAAPDPQDLGVPEPDAKRRKKVPAKSRKSHRPFAISAM